MKSIEFAINRVNHLVQEGDVVSLDKNGVLRQGAGTTLYRNIQEIHNQTLYHLHTVVIQETIHVAQYDSEMLVTVFDPDTDEIIATDTVYICNDVDCSSLFPSFMVTHIV